MKEFTSSHPFCSFETETEYDSFKAPGDYLSSVSLRVRMVFQILYTFESNDKKPLQVATTEEAFQQTTVGDLKEIIRNALPGKPGRLHVFLLSLK